MNLEEGATICLAAIGTPAQGVVALVKGVSQDQVQLRLTPRFPFEAEQQVRMALWEEEVVHTWDAVVREIDNNGNQSVTVWLSGSQTTVERRASSRIRRSIPFSFTVVDAAEPSLMGQQYHHVETQNICLGGIHFETSLPLRIGDRLGIELLASPTETIGPIGVVVRREECAGAPATSISVQFLQSEGQVETSLLEFLTSLSSGSSEDKRQFERWQVSLPCTVYRDAHLISGTITNISHGGALIVQAHSVPPLGGRVFLELETAGDQVLLGGHITVRVIHHIGDAVDPSEVGAFGIEFCDTPEEIREKLSRVLSQLDSPKNNGTLLDPS